MNKNYHFRSFPESRLATLDILEVSSGKHHVSALLEFDVTNGRKKLRELRRAEIQVSFTAWLIQTIGRSLENHPGVASSLAGKRKTIIFDEINVSLLIEKEIGEKRVPIPLVIEKANRKSAVEITAEIERAKDQILSDSDIVLGKKTRSLERIYYLLPGFLRRMIWKTILSHPKIAYRKMGNVVVTSLGMIGIINGWFIQKSIHPVSFGIGSVIKKPVVSKNEIVIREILNMTILFDHDVVDGAPIVRFINELNKNIENGSTLSEF
jgi:pyruvate/2-oxoglutarate dehydrogenase complex dihydrolipoamide acyltransferase (E2) component